MHKTARLLKRHMFLSRLHGVVTTETLRAKSKFMSDSNSRVLYTPKLQGHDEIISFVARICALQIRQLSVEHDFRLPLAN